MVFTCLSHDVIAHEAFADIVAIFQHFSLPGVLDNVIAGTRGDLSQQNELGKLAFQLGQSIGNRGALRDAIGEFDPDTKEWTPKRPDPNQIHNTFEPHHRGSILVAAIFATFLKIYRGRIRDLMRIATNGTGVLPGGEIHPDLVRRLSAEARTSAQHLLQMCIRALDYCPPVDVTFGEYLRALITSDVVMVPDDTHKYRIALIESFQQWGIHPEDVRSLSIDSLAWSTPTPEQRKALQAFFEIDPSQGGGPLLKGLNSDWNLRTDREEVFQRMQANKKLIHAYWTNYFSKKRNLKAIERLRAAGDVGTSEHIMGLLGFSSGVRKDLEYVLGRVAKPTYLRPGTQATKSLDTPGFRCYVLGPPDDDDTSLLKKSNPSQVDSEVYEHSFSVGTRFPLSATDVFASGILACASHSELLAVSKETGVKIDGGTDFSRPFECEHEIPVGKAKQQAFFKENFGFSKRTSDGPEWRRIDTEWLAGAAGLAMQLDGAVNNTSLVLAFEIAESGTVLLFPGDAQVGNMLSWHKHRWDVDGDEVKAEDLLHRTSFYKVGHHGSHNATLKGQGLELMNGDDFTAVIPVSKVMAGKQGTKGIDGKPVGWKMPFQPLLDALTEKAEHRVIQADDGRPRHKPSGMSNFNWTAFKKRVKQTKLFVEIEV